MLRGTLVAAGTVVVFAVEKIPAVAACALKVRVVDGIVFGAPFLALVLWLEYRAWAKGKAQAAGAPAPRRAPFSQYGGRR